MNTPKTVIKIVLLLMALASLLMFAAVAAEYFRLGLSESGAEVLTEEPPAAPPKTVQKSAPKPTPTPKPIPGEVKALMEYIPFTASEMGSRPGMFGRLVFPDTGISVALFTDGAGETVAEKRQGICDAQDSAALYYDEEGAVIADHNNQSFAGLINVSAGDRAYIITADSVLELICTGLIDGHNNDHKGLVDEDYAPIRGAGDFLCYTCKENWLDIRVAVLDILDEYSLYD